ncbi:CPBP family intramembrane metalloprotease [Methylobacterium sp. C25]|uniref:CPBP family intramembrane glutamic endopeptidase n=1 Tax=Methylobacterium sp. C25 TaxID=2721622 RepID=UPI001F34A0D1|nr:CPBP family intramembrane glutamic endopeptidase [Methylobacterium sp. C25]MCE4224302.1 CPBP family intramembrane metalloprotease [Methylobacterium sp. C25]
MKSDPYAPSLDDAAVAPVHAGDAPHGQVPPPPPAPLARLSLVAWLFQALLLIAIPLALLTLASLLAIVLVRVGADLRIGVDVFTPEALRPRLPLREIAGRGVAADVLRQVLIAAFVVGLALWQDGAAWRRRLALTAPADPRNSSPLRLWLLLAVWPVIHIVWVTETARALNGGVAQGIHLSPFLSPISVVGWFAYVIVLAPIAEELVMRGEAFARASRIMRPAGAIAATALLFSLAHLSESGGIARPISLLPLAITLGWLRWRTGRLWPGMLLHGWSNLALITYLLWPVPD